MRNPTMETMSVRAVEDRGRWAVVRLCFGIGRMIGATAGFALVVLRGLDRTTIAVAAGTTLLGAFSRFLFRR